jgi:hypothetical protein
MPQTIYCPPHQLVQILKTRAKYAGTPAINALPYVTYIVPTPQNIWTHFPVPSSGQRYFQTYVPENARKLEVWLATAGARHLYLKHGSLPTPTSWDLKGGNGGGWVGGLWHIAFTESPQPGMWYGVVRPGCAVPGTHLRLCPYHES